MHCREETQPQVSIIITTIICTFFFSEHTCQSIDVDYPSAFRTHLLRHQRNSCPVPVHTFCRTYTIPCAPEKALITMPPPQLPLSQRPSQNPQRPVTSGHAIRVVSAHSSTRPFAPFSAHWSASLCSRKVCVTHSAVRFRKRIPRPHHSRRMFWVFSTVLTLVFILA